MINVLSLFDGISCGQIALERAGISVDKYYAAEVDKYAIDIAQKNYPNTIQLGDVLQIDGSGLPEIDLLIGGSPCQGFSFAGRRLNFDDPRSKLFFEYVRLLKEVNPRYFLLENVKMKKESQDVITEHLGVEPVVLNSSLVSAQNRVRYYWTNIPVDKRIVDKELAIADILIPGEHDIKDISTYSSRHTKNYVQFDVSGKGYNSQQDRAYYTTGKFGTFPNARAITKRKIYLGDYMVRDLSLNECESLQTIPHDYTLLDHGFSLNKSLSAIGNGWTVDIVAHIFKTLNRRTP